MMEGPESSSQYDSLLGGHQSLPPSLHVGDFLSARIQEIKALTEVIETPSSAIAEMRSFPKHMRRRAMSHNIKRIPKRLRELHAALREKSNTREGPTKVPRRKHRRRPKELLKEYNRRQKKSVWLETHIWHAKRFKMITKWGYKLPLSPNDKSYRACYRATANYCLLQDISYNNCIELSGLETTLLSGLSRHTSPETGLTFAAKASLFGGREGSVMFYKANKFPLGAIGEIDFIWKPSTDDGLHTRNIWLWCHPGTLEELLQELINTFDLTKSEQEDTMECSEGEDENLIEMKKVELRNIPFVRTPKYSSEKGITLVILKDTLNRFRLTGPLSQAIISQNLKPICTEKRCRKGEDDWVQHYYFGGDQNTINACEAQRKLWTSMEQFHSSAQLPPRCVIPLTVIDPRFVMPSSRRKAEDVSSSSQQPPLKLPLDSAHLDSPLWSHFVRDNVTMNKLSTEQINRLRSEKLVPGLNSEWIENNEQDDLPCLPVILIQRPGSQNASKRLGYGCGWDVIIPCGYAMPLWLSFILSGARAGGLREAEAFSRELGNHQMCLQPDTTLGKAEETDKKNELTDQFFRLPPAKRRNYIKLNVPTPFHCPWSVLTKDWEGTEEFYIVRNKKMLYLLYNVVKQGSIVNFPNMSEIKSGGLIPVRLDILGKGNICRCAHICLLRVESDLHTPPKEPPKTDELHLERINLRTQHKKLLRHLARKRHTTRIAEREERFGSSVEDVKYKEIILENSSEKYNEDYAEAMRNLWLPSCQTIKETCSRRIIGFVSNGDFCFTEGMNSGVGYVTLSGLKEYLQHRISNKNYILIRCTNTDQYRLASINVIW